MFYKASACKDIWTFSYNNFCLVFPSPILTISITVDHYQSCSNNYIHILSTIFSYLILINATYFYNNLKHQGVNIPSPQWNTNLFKHLNIRHQLSDLRILILNFLVKNKFEICICIHPISLQLIYSIIVFDPVAKNKYIWYLYSVRTQEINIFDFRILYNL